MPTCSSSSIAPSAACERVAPAAEAEHLGDLTAGRLDRVERRHRVLGHVRDHAPARLAQLAPGGRSEVEVPDHGVALHLGPGRQQPRDRVRGRRLAAARLPDDRQRLSGADRERDAAHRVGGAVADVQVRHRQPAPAGGRLLRDRGRGAHRVPSRVRGSSNIRSRSIASVAMTTRTAATTTVPISTGRSTL